MAIVLSTAPIFSMGTLMSASCGALQPASPALPFVEPWLQTARALNQPVRTLPQPEQLPSLPELVKYSYRSPAALFWSRRCWETGSGRAAHIQQHHAGIFPLRATASASPLPSLSLTLLLSSWLSLSFSLPLSFLGCRAVHGCLVLMSPHSQLLQPELNKFSSFSVVLNILLLFKCGTSVM